MQSRSRKIAMLLRRLLEAVKDVKKAIQEYTFSPHAAEECERQKEPTPNKPTEIRAIVSFDNQTVRDEKEEQNRQYATQNSIKWATWSAVFAASVYAAIAACQFFEMR